MPLSFLPSTWLSVDGRDPHGADVLRAPARPEEMGLEGPRWRVPEAFDDGEALWVAVFEHELEGVVAKRLHEPYLPGEGGWVKVKNRAYWRYELERERAIRSRQPSPS